LGKAINIIGKEERARMIANRKQDRRMDIGCEGTKQGGKERPTAHCPESSFGERREKGGG